MTATDARPLRPTRLDVEAWFPQRLVAALGAACRDRPLAHRHDC